MTVTAESRPIRVLLVEDNPGDARLILELLRDVQANAFNLERVDRLEPALARLGEAGVDVVLLDLGLPDSQGMDTFRRTQRGARSEPIIVISGLDDERIAVEAVRAGAQDYLVKGRIEGPLLARVIRYAIERKRAEDKLRESFERYHTTLDSMMEGCQILDHDWRYLYINAAAARHGRVPKEHLLGRTMPEAYPGIETTEMFAKLIRSARERVPIQMENQFIYPDGSVAWFELRIQPVPEGVFVLSIDITERKHAEHELRARDRELHESEERFRQMAENIKEAFFVVDLATGTPVYVSPTWSEIWGRPIEQGSDPSVWFEAVHPDDREALAADQAAVAAGQPSVTTFRVIRPDGSMRWVRGRAFPVRDTEGRVYRMVGVSEDITQFRRVEEQMAQAQKMEAVGRLAGGVAHDFNNLLTVILGEADMAQMEATEPLLKESLAEIKKAGERAAALTRQLLAFSRHQVVDPTTFALNAVVSDMDKMLRRLIGEDIAIETRLAPDAGLIRADRGQMEQVLANLAVNARDAMLDGGRLIIETARLEVGQPRVEATGTLAAGAYALLSVTDSGTGMDPVTVSHIFEPFFTTKESGKGTGLGLSTVYGIVQQCGGQVGVYTEPGIGTAFRIYLPLADGAASDARPVRDSGEVRVGTETILLVEDDSAVRRIAKGALERHGYRILEAGAPAEALGVADAFRGEIHLLVTDVVMPGMGGQDLVARIGPLRPTMRILFTSGYTERAISLPGVGGKNPAFIQKPFTPEELLRKVRRVLDE